MVFFNLNLLLQNSAVLYRQI